MSRDGHPDLDALSALAGGELAPGDGLQLRRHVETCPECQAGVQLVQATRRVLSSAPRIKAPRDYAAGLRIGAPGRRLPPIWAPRALALTAVVLFTVGVLDFSMRPAYEASRIETAGALQAASPAPLAAAAAVAEPQAAKPRPSGPEATMEAAVEANGPAAKIAPVAAPASGGDESPSPGFEEPGGLPLWLAMFALAGALLVAAIGIAVTGRR